MQKTQFPQVIAPGATIGMVGGGQLGRMFAMAAVRMGYRIVIFCESDQDPAAQVAHDCVVGTLDDAKAIEFFASQCDCVTLEFENIPSSTIARCSEFAPTFPSDRVLRTAQNRILEKRSLTEAGLPVALYAEVSDLASLERAAQKVGLPLILKTAESGYDGKGQHRINGLENASDVDWNACDCWVAEQLIPFDREVSVIVARSADGRTSTFPVFENVHTNHILDITTIPAAVSDEVKTRAAEIATTAATSLDVVGLLCVEMFVVGDEVLINEIAPRPHNSGHLTIEACRTSQFEQHVRAVCGLPLGDPTPIGPAAAMANILSDLWGPKGESPEWEKGVGVPGVSLHLYGKQDAKPGRKMGHLTTVGSDVSSVVASVKKARELSRFETRT